MRKIENRLAALESSRVDASRTVHLVIQRVGQTGQEARAEYGETKISSDDEVILVKMVTPIWEEGIVGGEMLPQLKVDRRNS